MERKNELNSARALARRGVVLSLDALVAFLLFSSVVAVLYLFEQSFWAPVLTQDSLQSTAQHTSDALNGLRVVDVRREPEMAALFDSGTLSDEDLNRTLVEVIGSFWAVNDSGNASIAANLSRKIFSPFLPENVEWAFLYDDDPVYNSTDIPYDGFIASSRKLVSGIAKSLPSTGCVASAYLQKIAGKSDAAYYYFGGFVGQGTIAAVVNGVPVGSNATQIFLEASAGDNFSLYANGVFCGQFNISNATNYSVANWSVTEQACLTAVAGGAENNFTVSFNGTDLAQQFFGGGFLKILYNTTSFYTAPSATRRFYLPGIDGLINYYSSFYVPGVVTNVSGRLHFYNNYTTNFTVGNRSVYNSSGSEYDQLVLLGDSDFSAFNYSAEFSGKNVPLKFWAYANVTGGGGYADVILITDKSGSMDWRMDSDSTYGVNRTRTCDDPNIYDNDTQRLSVARCLDKQFVEAVLQGVGNRVGLVAFSSSADDYFPLSSDVSALENNITQYQPGGYTCICCAINRAYELLNGTYITRLIPSGSSWSYNASFPFTAPPNDSNGSAWNNRSYNVSWQNASAILGFGAGVTTDIGDNGGNYFFRKTFYVANVSLLINANLTVYSDDAAEVYLNGVLVDNDAGDHDASYWNRVVALDNALFVRGWNTVAVKLKNNDAVSAKFDAEINASWIRARYIIVMSDGVPNIRCVPTCSAPDFRSVSMYNGTQGFTVGTNGVIYAWDGSSWNSQEPPSTYYDLYGVSNRLESTAFAVGESGKIYLWSGASWTQQADMGRDAIYAVSTYNNSLAFSVGASGKIYRWLGSSWAQQTDKGSTTWYGVSVYNGSLAFAVGSSGKIERWLGGSWSEHADTGSNTFYAVNAYNGSLAFAVGDSGKIYRWLGGAWAQHADTGGNTFYAVDVWNGSLAFAAGSSGLIYRWNGSSWASQASPTSNSIRGLSFVNGSYAKAVTSGGEILHWNGVSWTIEWQYQCDNGNLTAGNSCSDNDACSLSTSCPSRNANYSSCRARRYLNATVHSIGFGPVASCNFANTTLYAVAQCGNGSYFASNNASELADFYRNLANAIVKQSTTQVASVIGEVSSILYSDSWLDFSFAPDTPPYGYQEMSVDLETQKFPSCTGSFVIPSSMRVDEFRVSSYSGEYWTDNATLLNGGTGGWTPFFNLSVYGSLYQSLGDPYALWANASLIRSGETNYVSIRTGNASSTPNPNCSSWNQGFYKARVRAAVNYSSVFLYCRARNATIYYDSNYDGIADGNVNVTVGGSLPSAGEAYVPPENFSADNAVDDALQRLLNNLDFVPTGTGPVGSITNPVGLKLSESIGLQVLTGEGIPFAWGPSEAAVVIWGKQS